METGQLPHRSAGLEHNPVVSLALGGAVMAAGVVIGATLVGRLARRDANSDYVVRWPLPEWPPDTVQEWRWGERSFGASREGHIHAGIDLGPPRVGEKGRAFGSPVLSPVTGRVSKVGGGWSGTEADQIQIDSPVYGLVVLGAMHPTAAVVKGQQVKAGELVGWLGRYPSGATMLHLEQHGRLVGTRILAAPRVRWEGKTKPSTLIDPRQSLLRGFM